MKKLFAFLLIIALLFAGIIATSGSASAKDKSCDRIGTANAFSLNRETNYQFPDVDDTFPEFVCLKAGFRVYVAKANTAREYVDLKMYAEDFAYDIPTITPTMFCKTGENRGFVIDLAYYYGLSDVKLKKPLRDKWGRYLKSYKSGHNCVIFSKKGK